MRSFATLSGLVGCAVLVAGVLPSTGLSAPAAAASFASIERSRAVLTPGTIFVANASAGFEGGLGTGNGSVTAYRPTATGDEGPVLVLTKGILDPTSLIFDSSDDLWVGNNSNSDNVVEYSKVELIAASPAPTVTISESGAGAMGVAFDPSGDLWITKTNFTAVELTKAQLTESGSPVPEVTITNTDQCSVVFDSLGDMWEGSFDSVVREFTPTRLAESGSPAPIVTVSSDSLSMPCQPTLDSAGDLWAANYLGNSVVEFTKAQLAESGSPTARVTITSDYLAYPGDAAFDPGGDLWVPSAQDEAVVEFTKAQLTRSGTPTPARAVYGSSTGLSWPWALAVEP